MERRQISVDAEEYCFWVLIRGPKMFTLCLYIFSSRRFINWSSWLKLLMAFGWVCWRFWAICLKNSLPFFTSFCYYHLPILILSLAFSSLLKFFCHFFLSCKFFIAKLSWSWGGEGEHKSKGCLLYHLHIDANKMLMWMWFAILRVVRKILALYSELLKAANWYVCL